MTRRRPALSMIEALMAIFVTAIGLLALLTLFPLGAAQMAQSIKDQRTAECASNAAAVFKTFNVGNDPAAIRDPARPAPLPTLFEQLPPYNPPRNRIGAAPSYPIYVDPQGAQAGMGRAVGGTTSIPRTPILPYAVTTNPALVNPRWTTLQDDLTFDNTGHPDQSFGAGVVQREGRYTCAWMVRRASANDNNPTDAVDLTVVVYSGRATGQDGIGPIGERAFTATFGITGPDLIDIAWDPTVGQVKPALRRGSWVLDARLAPAPQGYFYRVTSVTEQVPATAGGLPQIEVEVQAPLGGPLRNFGFAGPLVVMESVSEVFEKGTNY